MLVDFQCTAQHYVWEDRTLLVDAYFWKGDGHLVCVLNGMPHINGGHQSEFPTMVDIKCPWLGHLLFMLSHYYVAMILINEI
jgi:hypothetical protein